MASESDYKLYIDVFRPDSIPMERLARYMASFAELLGSEDKVRFRSLEAGSLRVVATVESVAQPKVERRLQEVRFGQGAQAAQNAAQDLDDLLAEDNAIGKVMAGQAVVVEFPGRTRPRSDSTGPIIQKGYLDGEIVHISGRDSTINVHLRSNEKCVCSIELARELAKYLFVPGIRLFGTGTFERRSNGWSVKRFTIEGYSQPDSKPLSKLFGDLRERLKPPPEGRQNPVELMQQLREE